MILRQSRASVGGPNYLRNRDDAIFGRKRLGAKLAQAWPMPFGHSDAPTRTAPASPILRDRSKGFCTYGQLALAVAVRRPADGPFEGSESGISANEERSGIAEA